MKHIREFPLFTEQERADLCSKILAGTIEKQTPDREHFDRAVAQGKAWTHYMCWVPATKWQDGKGFKKTKFKKHTLYIHRAAYEVIGNKTVPNGMLLDHLCRNRACCQPHHLEPVPTKENILRGGNQNHLLRGGAAPPVAPVPVLGVGDPPPANGLVPENALRRRLLRSWLGRLTLWLFGSPP